MWYSTRSFLILKNFDEIRVWWKLSWIKGLLHSFIFMGVDMVLLNLVFTRDDCLVDYILLFFSLKKLSDSLWIKRIGSPFLGYTIIMWTLFSKNLLSMATLALLCFLDYSIFPFTITCVFCIIMLLPPYVSFVLFTYWDFYILK